MSKSLLLLLLLTYLSSSALSTPVIDSEDVGTVEIRGKKAVVTGHTLYPFVVYLRTSYIRNEKRFMSYCTGVIIGEKTVLTAAHCLHNKVDLKVIVHAGIVDTKWEKSAGQKINMKDFLIHQDYQEHCTVEPKKCCYDVNDLAILWLEKKFTLGLKVEIANLNIDRTRLVDKRGYIVGWGHNEDNKEPTMLQRGLMKVISQDECKRFSPKIHIDDTVMCLRPAARKTGASGGDSGGPFVRNGIVYGIASISLYNTPCRTNKMDVYTYVAEYSRWIDINLLLGPPQERIGTSFNKASPTRIHSNI